MEDEKKVAAEEKKKKWEAEKAATPKPVESTAAPNKTLFVRNISYDTDQQALTEFMARFGAVKYAVLCKPKSLQGE